MTYTGSDAAALCFFPTGQHSSCPQPITHFIDATATGRHQLISCSGRQSNGPGFGSHSHYARQGNPATSRVRDQACPTKTGSDGQCIPRKAYAAPDAVLFYGAAWQNNSALCHQAGKGHGTMVKAVMRALPSCLACKAHQPSTT